jgi:hypothetical protein
MRSNGMSMTEKPVSASEMHRAKRVIAEYTAPIDWNWDGVSPSYLCADMPISYTRAEAILLALEAEGYVYDNGNGGRLRRPDGTPGRNRFYPSLWLETMTPEQRRKWEAEHAKDVEWDRREAEWDAANIPPGASPMIFMFPADELENTYRDIDAFLAVKARLLQEHLLHSKGATE